MLTNLALALPLLLPDPAAPAADAAALLRAVPADAVFVVSIADLDALRADMAENAWVALLKDPELGRLWGLWNEMVAELPEAGGQPLDPLRVLGTIHGPVAAFVDVAPGGAISGGLLIEPGEDHQAFDGLFNTLAGALGMESEAGRELHGDTTLLVYSAPPAEDAIPLDDEDPDVGDGELELESWDEHGDDTEPDHAVLFQAGGLSAAVFGRGMEPTLQLARQVIDRYGAAGQSAAGGSALLAEARQAVGGPRRIEAVVNLQRVVELAMQEDPPTADDAKLVEKLGVQDLRWAYMGASLGKGEAFDLDMAVRLPSQGFLREVATFLQPYPQRLARLAPPDTASAGLWGFDVWGLWQAGWKFAESIQPEGAAQGRAQLDMVSQSMGGIDIEADFLSQLTGEFGQFGMLVPHEEWRSMEGMWVDAIDADAGEGPQLGSVYVVGVKDPGIVQLFIEDVLGIAGMADALETEEVEGLEVQTVRMGEGMGISWLAGERSLVVTPYPSAVRALVKQMGNPDAPSILQGELGPALKAAQSASMVSVADTAVTMRTSLTLLRAVAESSGEVPADMVPDPALVERYLDGTLVSTMRMQGDTLLLQYRSR